LRIIGGQLRGRRLASPEREETRPMKHRVREAVFDLLGPNVAGGWAIDLFAGSGALGLEAISRGAAGATLIERHVPTAKLVEQNAAHLGVQNRVNVLAASAFVWARRGPFPQGPWIVFCSPPYDFYVERRDEMLDLVRRLTERAPPGSTFVVEGDERLEGQGLPHSEEWTSRAYPPAVIWLLRTALG
jgi:16S rRNA (guanine966-N2)-methyltransferase